MNKKIALLSGAFENGGDYFITLRGKEILEKYIPEFKFEIILRDEKINLNGFDGAIILGGPIVTNKLHKQARNVFNKIKKTNIPIFVLGVGINGKSKDINNFQFDNESKKFWKNIFSKTKLISVRDKYTYSIFKKIEISSKLTGCPTLSIYKKNKSNNNIAINIPNLQYFYLTRFNEFISTIYLLYKIKEVQKNNKVGVIYPHGIKCIGDKIVYKYSKFLGFENHDYSNKSFDEGSIDEYYINIGPRLHTHIYYLTNNKPSYLLNLDLRTYGFSKTIKAFPRFNFNIKGINKLLNNLKKNIEKNEFKFLREFEKERKIYEKEMKKFILDIKRYYK